MLAGEIALAETKKLKKIEAEKLPYWKTSRTASDTWIAKAVQVLRDVGATDIHEAFVSQNSVATYVLAFKLNDSKFRLMWPVLQPRVAADMPAARIQAATFMYHSCKAKAMEAAVIGARAAFAGQLLLGDDRQTVAEASDELLSQHFSATKRLT